MTIAEKRNRTIAEKRKKYEESRTVTDRQCFYCGHIIYQEELVTFRDHDYCMVCAGDVVLPQTIRKEKHPRWNRSNHPGYVYLIGGDKLHKVGITEGEVEKRLTGIQNMSPVPLTLVHSFYCDDCRNAERIMHDVYEEFNSHGEWFHLNEGQVYTFCTISGFTDNLFIQDREAIISKSKFGFDFQ